MDRYCGLMSSWEAGRSTVDYLLGRGRLEAVSAAFAESTSDAILARAGLRLSTARAAMGGGDTDGAFVAAYDAYRMAAESLLARQGLRATGGDGSHVTVEDSVSAQFAMEIEPFAKPTFERFRRTRHAGQYFDPDAPEITADDVDWALATAETALSSTRDLCKSGRLPLFSSQRR